MSVCCYCGNPTNDYSKYFCHICEQWGISPEEIAPTFTQVLTEQYHRIGKNGKKYWGRLGAGILFTDGERILLLKRADKEETWSVPGGRAEEGETPLDAARRETKEECGTIEGHRIGHFHSRDGAHHFHTYLYAVEKPFDCELSKEHSKWKWAKIKNVEEMNLHPRFKESWPSFLAAIKKHFPLKNSFSEWVESKNTNNSFRSPNGDDQIDQA